MHVLLEVQHQPDNVPRAIAADHFTHQGIVGGLHDAVGEGVHIFSAGVDVRDLGRVDGPAQAQVCQHGVGHAAGSGKTTVEGANGASTDEPIFEYVPFLIAVSKYCNLNQFKGLP